MMILTISISLIEATSRFISHNRGVIALDTQALMTPTRSRAGKHLQSDLVIRPRPAYYRRVLPRSALVLPVIWLVERRPRGDRVADGSV